MLGPMSITARHLANFAPSPRYSRRLSAVDSTPIASKRFLMVPVDSSAARMPLPGATMAWATLLSSARFMGPSIFLERTRRQGAALPRRSSPRLGFQDFDARQGLALEPFEESAAGGRNIGEPVAHARRIERRYRVAPARDRNQLAGPGELGRGFRDFDRAVVERLDLEGPDRPVPQQSFRPRQRRDDVFHAARPPIKDHFVLADRIDRDHARGRMRFELA